MVAVSWQELSRQQPEGGLLQADTLWAACDHDGVHALAGVHANTQEMEPSPLCGQAHGGSAQV